MIIAVVKLEGFSLDWAVSKAIDLPIQRDLTIGVIRPFVSSSDWGGQKHSDWGIEPFMPTELWRHGGPLLSEHAICVKPITDCTWEAEEMITHCKAAATDSKACNGYLTAAMRALVLSELGDVINVPDSLL